MAVSPAHRQAELQELTYEEYLRQPEMIQRHEVLEGVLTMSPAPTSEHQWLLGELVHALRAYVRERRLGVVLPAPVDVVIRKTPKLQTRQPDVLFLSAARTGIRGRRELRKMPLIEVSPDLAVEILSPEDPRRSLAGKLYDYATIGLLEVWLVSPEAETVEVLKLEDQQYVRAGLYGQGDTILSTVLPEFAFTVEVLFAE